MKHRHTTVLAIVALAATLIPATVATADNHISISEIRIDQPGADVDEYFELTGSPADASLDGLTYLVIGDGASALGSGVIENVTDLRGQSLCNGFFLAAESSFTLGTPSLTTNLNFENDDNLTHLLVDGFTGSNGDDLDTDDDGTLDVTPWDSVVDLIALVKEPNPPSTTEYHYGPPSIGPDGTFVPGHVFFDGEWQIGNFFGGDDSPVSDDCGDVVEPTPLDIPTIQGDGFSSPHEGEFVIIDGVVTAVFQTDPVKGQQLGGFFVQEESPGDGDDTTSDGIFVFAPFAEVAEGDVVEVVGTVAEFDQLTEITDVQNVEVVGTASLPAPTEFTLPATDAEREAVEGMLVSLTQNLHIVEFFDFDRTNEVVLATTRQFQGTHSAPPGSQAVAIAEQNALNQVRIDDARISQNPDWNQHPDGSEFKKDNSFRGGDLLLGVTGVMDEGVSHSFDDFPDYRVQPTEPASHVETNPRPSAPDEVGGDIKVASFNVLNFFTHIDSGPDICGPTANLDCRGADSEEEFDRQLTKLVLGILALDADIVGIQEIENDILDDEPLDPDPEHHPVLTLVEALNLAEGSEVWAWVGETNHYNDYPVRNEIIYKPASVTPVGEPVALADEAFDDTRPGDIEPLGRPPLAQTFRQNVTKGSKQPFTVVVNHFKSKGSSCTSIGDPDVGDGQSNCNLTRVAQSEALLDFVAELSEDASGVLVIGDLNSYAMEDPITTLEDAGFTDLVEELVGPDAYSFVFDGQLGYLDTALATRSMLNSVTGTTIFHINADEPDIIDYDTSFKSDTQIGFYEPTFYRASDHDPVIVGLAFGGPER